MPFRSPHSHSSLCTHVQDGDTYPDFPEDGDLPEGEAEVKARIEAATAIKARGNDLFKQVRGPLRAGGPRGVLISSSCRCCRAGQDYLVVVVQTDWVQGGFGVMF